MGHATQTLQRGVKWIEPSQTSFPEDWEKKKIKNPETVAPAYGSHQVLLPPWRTEPDGLSRNLLEISQCFSSSCLHKAANSHPAGGMLSSYTPPHISAGALACLLVSTLHSWHCWETQTSEQHVWVKNLLRATDAAELFEWKGQKSIF